MNLLEKLTELETKAVNVNSKGPWRPNHPEDGAGHRKYSKVTFKSPYGDFQAKLGGSATQFDRGDVDYLASVSPDEMLEFCKEVRKLLSIPQVANE